MQRIIALLVVLAAAAGTANARFWNAPVGGPNNFWDNAANWDPVGVPVITDKVQFSRDRAECIIDSAAVSGQLVVGDNGPDDLVHRLTIVNGGSLTCGGTAWAASGYNRSSVVTVEEGGSLESVMRFGVGLVAGPMGAPQTSHLNINGGEMVVNGNLQIGSVGDSSRSDHTGIVNVYSGTLDVTGTLEFRDPSVSFIDISYGTLTVNGDRTALVADMADNDPPNITAFGGEGAVHYDYNVRNPGKTTVWAEPASVDFGTGDVNGDGCVDETDLLLFAAEWLDPDPDPDADFTRDEPAKVDIADFGILAKNWKHNEFSRTLTGKIMCGYQGWFNCPDDGAGRGWVHWGRSGRFEPGYCTVDWWPDMSEYDADEKFATGFEHADGSTAYVFSSYNEKTVLRHFSWMSEYGIDGVFLQRFATETNPGSSARRHRDRVMLSCREAGNLYNRVWAMMYDISGLGQGQTQKVIDDWKYLVDVYGVGRDPADSAYLHHNGKPVVAIWGIGFKDRSYTLDECLVMVNFFKNDPVYGGCTVMLGVPSYWRTLSRDCVSDAKVHDIILAADIISPWAVGRFGSKYESELDNYANNVWIPDAAWCYNRGIDYMPVVFPGFSWQNLKGEKFDHIPRRGGQFLWRQYYKAIVQAGATMVYQAMFDEVDEGTAIFKCTSNPPVGETPFLPTGNALYPPYDISDAQLPSDHYLWLVGQAGRMLRGEIQAEETMPVRTNH